MSESPRAVVGLGAVPFAPIEALRDAGARVIDLRSPSEFADDHVPGALNVPLFDDQERALVGLLYRRFSPQAAFDEGRAVVAGKALRLVERIAEAAGWTPRGCAGAPTARELEQRVLAMTDAGIGRMEAELAAVEVDVLPSAPIALHCWRGGLRSRSVLALVRALGLERAVGVVGGYRSWRARVMADLAAWPGVRRTFALRGLTGVGKTLVLREIERLRPGSTLDLEALAGHRSSLLGMVGLEPATQKTFETRVRERLARGFADDVMIVEGESRKVGDVVVPPRVWAALQGATNLWLEAPLARRVDVLVADYLARPDALPVLRRQLEALGARMPKRPDLVALLDAGETRGLVELLLLEYYDPLYGHSEAGRVQHAAVDASDPAAAARRVLELVEAG